MYNITFVGLFLGISSVLLGKADDIAARIEKYRDLQKYVSEPQYQWYEKEIGLLKKAAGIQEMDKEHSPIDVDYVGYVKRAIPFFVLQILFLMGVFIVIWYHYYSCWFMAMLVCMLFCLSKNYTDRAKLIKIIWASEATMYVGPGDNYPVLKKLSYLDEVNIITRHSAHTYPGWIYGEHRGIKGWIPDDTICQA